MLCPNCREENPGDNAYCGRCGAGLLATSEDVPRYPDRSRVVRREIGILVAGVVLLLTSALGAWLIFFHSRSPESVVRKFIEADRNGDFTLEGMYVSSSFDSRMILSLMQTIRQTAGVSPFKTYIIKQSHTESEFASVNVEVTITSTTPPNPLVPAPRTPPAPTTSVYTIPFVLVREGGEWRIDSTQTVAGLTGVLLAMGLKQMPGGLFGPNGPLSTPIPLPFPNGPGMTPPTGPPSTPSNGSGAALL